MTCEVIPDVALPAAVLSFYLLRDVGIKVSVVGTMTPVVRVSPTLNELAANKQMIMDIK